MEAAAKISANAAPGRKFFRFARLVGLLVWGATLSSAPTPPASEARPTATEVAGAYPTYQQITKQAVEVNPELAMLCAGVRQEQVDQARVKFGPHTFASILVDMNEPAAGAFTHQAKWYPPASVVVKQKGIHPFRDKNGGNVVYGSGVGGMIKRSAGYDPAHGDWEYFYFEARSEIETGRLASCIKCHEAAKTTDYVFGTWHRAKD